MSHGYFETPNKYVPYNDREKGEIASIAEQQLLPYQIAAQSWPMTRLVRYSEISPPRECNVCRICGQNIWFTSDPAGMRYSYVEPEILTLIVAHVRQVHADIVHPDGTIDYVSPEEK